MDAPSLNHTKYRFFRRRYIRRFGHRLKPTFNVTTLQTVHTFDVTKIRINDLP